MRDKKRPHRRKTVGQEKQDHFNTLANRMWEQLDKCMFPLILIALIALCALVGFGGN